MAPSEQRGAAFFDLDKTLMEGSSALHFARASYKAGQLSKRQMARDVWANVKFRLEGSTDEATDALRERVYEAIGGRRVVDLARLTPEILAGILPRIYPQMLEVAWRHQDAGRPVFIVTAASQEIAELLGTVLVFDGGIGACSEVRDGVYTGKPEGPFTYREGKAEAIRDVAVREGFDLAESFAYSDSESDLPMLRAVGHPVAVNPDAELQRIASDEGWDIVRFDKLGRRLRVLAGAAAVAIVGGGGGYVAARLRPRRRAAWLPGYRPARRGPWAYDRPGRAARRSRGGSARGRHRHLHGSLAAHLSAPVELGLRALRARVGGAGRSSRVAGARVASGGPRLRRDGAPHRLPPARAGEPRRAVADRDRSPVRPLPAR